MIVAVAALAILLFAIGVPLFLVIGTFTVGWILVSSGPLTIIPQVLYSSLTPFVILAVPGFIFAGQLMGTPKVSHRLTDFVQALVGSIPGALPVSVAGTSEFFGAISGSSPATVAALGGVLFPVLLREGYTRRFSAALIASCGAIAIIIPPSINMLIFGSITGVSVSKLFIGGILPGILVGVCLATYIVVTSIRHRIGNVVPFSLPRLWQATKGAVWILVMPLLVLGGIYGGVFTPTEASVVAAGYSALISLAIYREVTWRDILSMAANSATLTAKIFIIVAVASLFSWQLTTSGFVDLFTHAMQAFSGSSPVVFLLVVNVALLVVGMFMDPLSATVILGPIIYNMGTAFGLDGVFLGVVVAVNLAIGMFTPPFGLNLFVASSALDIKSWDLYRGIVPFFLVDLVSLAIITYIPWLSLWLPSHI